MIIGKLRTIAAGPFRSIRTELVRNRSSLACPGSRRIWRSPYDRVHLWRSAATTPRAPGSAAARLATWQAERALDRVEHLARQKRLLQEAKRLRRLGPFSGPVIDQPGEEYRRHVEFLAQLAGQLDAVDRPGQPDIDERQ